MDRSWILQGRSLSESYVRGVEGFMEFVRRSYGNVDVPCPCRKCMNLKVQPQRKIDDHLFMHGMQRTYIRWVYHGEPYDQPDVIDPLADADLPEDPDAEDDEMDEDEDMFGLLRDLYPYASEKVQGSRKKPVFSDLIDDAKRSMGPGSDLSRFEFIVSLLHSKAYGKTSNKGFDAIVKVYSRAFPGSGLPKSFYEMKQYIKVLGLSYENIHVCRYNCVLFWKDYKELNECPVCKESRWEKDGAGGKKKVPWKVLRYFPLIDRLKKLFSSKQTSKETKWHKEILKPDKNLLRHPADGDEWKNFDKKYPEFAADPRNLRLGLATDGFNPFGNMSNSYSMWPVLVTPYNLPPWACTDQSNCILALLIPGPKSPGKDFDLFMQPLVEDLQKLWKGVLTLDVLAKPPEDKEFNLRAAVLYCTHDYPGLGTMSGRVTSGYNACVHCDKEQLSVKLIHKVGFVGHRRFLPHDHSYRRNSRRLQFIGERTEFREAPAKFSAEELKAHLEEVRNVKPGKPPAATTGTKRKKEDEPNVAGTKRKKGGGVAAGTKGKKKEVEKPRKFYKRRATLWDLPYWECKKLRHNVDIMHMEKNICDSIIGTLLNIPSKTKDSSNARLDCQALKVNKNLQLNPEDKVKKGAENHYKFRGAEFTLPMPKRVIFCDSLRDVRFPSGFASNIANCISAEGNKLQGLKTHDCHILLQRLLAIAVKDLVKPHIYNVLAELGRFFREICSKTLDRRDVERLKKDIAVILCKLELIYPPAFFDVMVHLAVHLPDEALLRGPVQYGWMYPIERRLCTFKQTVRNKGRPEASIAEAYIADEALTFCSRYIPDCETRFNRGGRIEEVGGSVFKHGVHLMGRKGHRTLEQPEYEQLCWYVLNHAEEAAPFVKLFEGTRGQSYVAPIRGGGFQEWFENHIRNLHKEKPGDVSADLLALSRGPAMRVQTASACRANGVCYSTYEREKHLKTQNSGITTNGDHFTARRKKSETYDHYGRVQEVIRFNYNDKETERSVVLFKCYWYDQDPNRKRGPKNDGYFTSINTTAQWYKDEPYILVTQASKVMFLNDRVNKGWQYVQKFEPRNVYDLEENETPKIDVAHQDDHCGFTGTNAASMDEIPLDTGGPAHDGEVDFTVEVSIVDKERNKLNLADASEGSDDEYEEEDPTLSEYADHNDGRSESDDDDE